MSAGTSPASSATRVAVTCTTSRGVTSSELTWTAANGVTASELATAELRDAKHARQAPKHNVKH